MLVIDLQSDNPANKFAPYQRMANVIIELTNKNGECFPEDLLKHGFSKEETRERWHMANAMAEVELKLTLGISSRHGGRITTTFDHTAASTIRLRRPIAPVCASLLLARSLSLVSPNNLRYLTKDSTPDRSIFGGKCQSDENRCFK
jgi:hypothetical protein